MTVRNNNPAKQVGLKEDNTFALHALLAYSASILLGLSLGSILQLYNITLRLFVTEIAFIAIPAAIILRMHRKTLDVKQFSIPNVGRFSLTILIGGCVALIAVYQGIAFRKVLLGVDTSGIDVTASFPFLVLVLLAPLCEELLFRPVIQSGLARHWSNCTAVILTAVLFSLFHLSLIRFAETFLVGLFAGIVFLKTRQFWCPVAVHLIVNALARVLWRNAPHLTFLLNPIMISTLTCVAFVGCYFLGEPSPTPLRGLLQHLKWAAFGTSESLQTMQKRSRKLALLTGVIVVCLIALAGYVHALTVRQMRRQEEPRFRSNYVVSEEDEWTVVSSDEIHVRSTLVIRKSPETYEDLIVQLPFQEATVQKVRLGDNDLPFSRPEPNEYRVDLSSQQDAARSGTITVLWNFPITCLTPPSEGRGYMTPLKSLVPSDSFSLLVTITDGSSFRFSFVDSNVRADRVFKASSDKPKMDYGNWCGLTNEEDKDTGGFQKGDPAATDKLRR
jgi:membrane protease YdiL (CAAX protease family)